MTVVANRSTSGTSDKRESVGMWARGLVVRWVAAPKTASRSPRNLDDVLMTHAVRRGVLVIVGPSELG